jgi:hypothetical protein
MNTVLKRLKKSKECSDQKRRVEGQEAGRVWATKKAEEEELEWLADYAASRGYELHLVAGALSAAEAAQWIFGEMHPDAVDWQKAMHPLGADSKFWAAILGDKAYLAKKSLAFLKGFVDGAVEVWNEEKAGL